MYYVVKTGKTFDQAGADPDAAVQRHQFRVLHVHDIGPTLRSKGQAFTGECKVFEVCSPRHAASVLATDLRMNMALPCRISVYTKNGGTRIGMIEPAKMLAELSDDPALAKVAREEGVATGRMVEVAA